MVVRINRAELVEETHYLRFAAIVGLLGIAVAFVVVRIIDFSSSQVNQPALLWWSGGHFILAPIVIVVSFLAGGWSYVAIGAAVCQLVLDIIEFVLRIRGTTGTVDQLTFGDITFFIVNIGFIVLDIIYAFLLFRYASEYFALVAEFEAVSTDKSDTDVDETPENKEDSTPGATSTGDVEAQRQSSSSTAKRRLNAARINN